jgi:hypothetical protein
MTKMPISVVTMGFAFSVGTLLCGFLLYAYFLSMPARAFTVPRFPNVFPMVTEAAEFRNKLQTALPFLANDPNTWTTVEHENLKVLSQLLVSF